VVENAGRNGNAYGVLVVYGVRIWASTQVIYGEVVRRFPQPLRTNAGNAASD
jgi:hypothetical protein